MLFKFSNSRQPLAHLYKLCGRIIEGLLLAILGVTWKKTTPSRDTTNCRDRARRRNRRQRARRRATEQISYPGVPHTADPDEDWGAEDWGTNSQEHPSYSFVRDAIEEFELWTAPSA
jgi:hypothetical protein